MNGERPGPYVDSHAHIQARQFGGDAAGVVDRAAAAGVGTIVCASDDEQSSVDAVKLAERFDSVWAMVGVHPHEAAHATAATWERLTELANSTAVVAIGEIGLDYYRDLSPRPTQRAVFQHQIELAATQRLPIVVHSRDAAEDTYAILRGWRESAGAAAMDPGVIHCFGYDTSWAERFLALGFLISVPGTVTYPKADRMKEVAVAVPQSSLLVETDSPYLAPLPWRGKRNEPAYLPETVKMIASLRGERAEHLGIVTGANARRLFRLDEPAGAGAARRGAS